MSTKPNASRREFLRAASMMTVVGASAAPFALNLATIGAAAAQTAPSDYKALICLFMGGGNDGSNTVLATDPASWSEYVRVRATGGGDAIALPSAGTVGGVLPILPKTTQAGRSFALHPSMQALKDVFDAGRVAIVANVGTLVMPTSLAQFNAGTVKVPPNLFSHNDQASVWQSSSPEGAQSGWGGRMGDLLMSANSAPVFTAISTAGNALFLAGRTLNQYQVNSAGVVPISSLDGYLFGAPAAANPLRAIISGDRANLFEKEHAAVVKRAIAAQGILAGAMVPAGSGGIAYPKQYTSPAGYTYWNDVAGQLQTVARIIAGRRELGVKRQIFMVSVGGFDTHDGQRYNQADGLTRVSEAMAYFDSLMANLQGVDMRSQVTLFTASDFGRTFRSNGDGTDHGWGSHHFVMGGAVKGQDIYGTYPTTGIYHENAVASGGSLLPQFSVDQYGSTMASWFGLSPTQIADVFPNIANFSNKNLGFMM